MLLALGLLTTAVATDTRPASMLTPGVAGVAEQPTAKLSPEVRLRKLHLVRPDLIPYPIQLEVYC
jgi:hypothetical protein